MVAKCFEASNERYGRLCFAVAVLNVEDVSPLPDFSGERYGRVRGGESDGAVQGRLRRYRSLVICDEVSVVRPCIPRAIMRTCCACARPSMSSVAECEFLNSVDIIQRWKRNARRGVACASGEKM